MTPEVGARVLNRHRHDVRATPEQLARLEAARAVVAAGPEGVDQEGAVAPLPPELEEHAARLKEVAGHLFEAGCQPALVDLTRL